MAFGASESPSPSEQSLGSGRLTVDVAGFLNDDTSNEALVVDYDSPRCSPGEFFCSLCVGYCFGVVEKNQGSHCGIIGLANCPICMRNDTGKSERTSE